MPAIKVAPVKPIIPVHLHDRIHVRVGTIGRVQDVRGSERLVKLAVDSSDSHATAQLTVTPHCEFRYILAWKL
jgi:hypothetical protein